MKVYKIVSHLAFDHVSNKKQQYKKALPILSRKIKTTDFNQKFNIQLVQRTTPLSTQP